jgi:hypothetical protein
MPDKPLWRRILNWPSTRLGWWSAGCLAGAFVFLCLFYGLVASGQRGGETFFSNPMLALTMLAAAGSAIAGGAVASAAIFSKQERSILSVVALAFGFTVVVFVIGEIAFPH